MSHYKVVTYEAGETVKSKHWSISCCVVFLMQIRTVSRNA